jgi:hypothetical protein
MELEPGLDPSVASPVGPRRHGSARFSWRPHPILQNRLLHSSPPSRIRPPPPPPPLPTSQGHSSPVPHGGELQETTATTASPSTPAAPLASHHHPSPTTVSIPAAASCDPATPPPDHGERPSIPIPLPESPAEFAVGPSRIFPRFRLNKRFPAAAFRPTSQLAVQNFN